MSKLKTLREAAKFTQSRLAKAVGVTQPHYRRWETGETPVPEKHLAKLAKLLKTMPEEIAAPKLKLVEPPASKGGAPEKSPFADYYGEVSFHFCGSGKPLVLSIDRTEMKALFSSLQDTTRPSTSWRRA